MPEPNSAPNPLNLPQTKFRVNQLDALMLDDEISSIIKNWIGSALSLVDGRLKLNLDQIILWCAKVVCRYVPILMSGGTFAMDMQGLYYKGHFALKLFYVILDSLLPVLQDRVQGDLLNLMRLMSLANYLIFIRSGKYPTLLHRLLQLEMEPVSQNLASGVDFEFMHRQLVWQAMTEFSLVVVPWVKSSFAPGGILLPVKNTTTKVLMKLFKRKKNVLHDSPRGQGCQLCHHQSPAMEKRLNSCGHMFCYYCITDWQLRNNLDCPVCSL